MQRQPAVFDLAELVRRMNAVAGRQRWSNWSLRRLLEAGGVELVQHRSGKGTGGRGSKLYVTLTAIRESFPDFYESLLDAESLARAASANDDDDYGRPVLSVG